MEGLEEITGFIGGGEISMSSNSIKVVILCGGMGTRLREETDYAHYL